MKNSNSLIKLFSIPVLFLVLAGSHVQAAQAISVQDFLEMKKEWKDLAKKKTKLTIEGRINSISKTFFRFRNCKISFRSNRKNGFRTTSIKSRTVEIYGILKKSRKVRDKNSDEPEYYFEVKTLSAIPSDMKSFENKRSFLKRDNPDAWLQLGKWALNRALFYEDNDLKVAGEEVIFQSFKIEKKLIPDQQYKPLFALIQKMRDWQFETIFPSEELIKYRHEAFRRWWNEVKANKLTDVDPLKNEIRGQLEGCESVITPEEFKLKESYDKNPVQVYNETQSEKRPALHRLFYIDIQYKVIMSRKQADGENGYKIASLLDKNIPEIKGFQEKLRGEELDLRKKRIQTFTRAEILDLAKKYEERKEIQNRTKVLKTWLEIRTNKELKEGPAGLILIARDYQLLLNDKNSAYELLLQAYEMNPKSEEIVQDLRNLGYAFQKGKWIKASDVEPTEVSKIQAAMKSGEVIKGMTEDQVTKTLGKPGSISKAASINKIDIVWIYGNRSENRLVIHFIKQRKNKKLPVKVYSISQLPSE
jgi:tetratricopeptide (TPR) repeat protein